MKCTDCNRETTYLITSEEVSNAEVGDIIEEFSAEDVEAAIAYADEHYSDGELGGFGIEWCADKRQAVTVYLNTRRWRGIRHGSRKKRRGLLVADDIQSKNGRRNLKYRLTHPLQYRLVEMEVRLSSCKQRRDANFKRQNDDENLCHFDEE